MRASGILRLLTIFAGLAWSSATSHAGDFTWTAGPDVAVPLLNSEDGDAGVTQDGSDLWVQTAFYPAWHRYLGKDLDSLVAQPDAIRDASFDQPHGDDAYWTNGIWQDPDGKRYAIIHVEYQYAVPRAAFLWKRRIGLATSTDHGAHWHYEGDILTTNPARRGAPAPEASFRDFGCGDTYLFVDRRNGYFYLYYMTAWVSQPSGHRSAQTMSVARCPIGDKMAAGKWNKWHHSAWTEAGLGGAEDAVFSGTDACVVHYNTYLKSFVAIGHDANKAAWISTCSDITAQNWQGRDYSFPQRLYWYNWPVDPRTHDRYEIGQSFRLYSAQANVAGVGTKYFPLSFTRNSGVAPTSILLRQWKGQ